MLFRGRAHSVGPLCIASQLMHPCAVADKYTAKGAVVKGFPLDLTKPETVPGVLAAIAADLGAIEIAVYNASAWNAVAYL